MRFSLILYYKRYQNYDRSKLKYLDLLRGCPYLTSDDRGSGGSAKSDFITKEALIKCLMRGGGGVNRGQKSSDVIYERPLNVLISRNQ